MKSLWYLGIALQATAALSGTVGKQLIRLSELVGRRGDASPLLPRALFCLGLVVNTVVGPVLDLASYSFAAQSLIAPFGGLDIVANALLAPLVLRERLSPGRVVGCVLVMLGASFAGAFGNHSEPEYTLEHLEATLLSPRVLAYALCFVAWFLLNRFWLMRFPAGSVVRGVSLGCTAGSIAGNMFCAKGAVELIQRSIHDRDGSVWLHWLPYIMIVGAAAFALSNLRYMTRGLQEYEALFMVTVYEGSMIVSGCVSGAVVLLDMQGVASKRAAVYWLGVVAIVGGMATIFSEEARRTAAPVHPQAPESGEDEPCAPPEAKDVEKTSIHIRPSDGIETQSAWVPKPDSGYSASSGANDCGKAGSNAVAAPPV